MKLMQWDPARELGQLQDRINRVFRDTHGSGAEEGLTIEGERKMPDDVKEDQILRVERRYGRFSRSFVLPLNVDPSKVSAEYTNGVLTVKFPLREEAKPRQIEIRAAA